MGGMMRRGGGWWGRSDITYVLLVHALLLRVLLLLRLQQRLQALRLLLQQRAAFLPLLHLPVETLHQRLQLLQSGAPLCSPRLLNRGKEAAVTRSRPSVSPAAAPGDLPEWLREESLQPAPSAGGRCKPLSRPASCPVPPALRPFPLRVAAATPPPPSGRKKEALLTQEGQTQHPPAPPRLCISVSPCAPTPAAAEPAAAPVPPPSS